MNETASSSNGDHNMIHIQMWGVSLMIRGKIAISAISSLAAMIVVRIPIDFKLVESLGSGLINRDSSSMLRR
jgi:hypothetical protein